MILYVHYDIHTYLLLYVFLCTAIYCMSCLQTFAYKIKFFVIFSLKNNKKQTKKPNKTKMKHFKKKEQKNENLYAKN